MFNNEETVREVSKIITRYDKDIRYKIIAFRNIGVRKSFSDLKSPSNFLMQRLKEISEEIGCNNIIIV